MKTISQWLFALVRSLLPPSLRAWGDAAFREAQDISRRDEALRFTLGCLFWALGEAIRYRVSNLKRKGEPAMGDGITFGTRGAAVLCGVGATGLGLAYMAAGGAPEHHLMINAGALAFGLVALGILALADQRWHLQAGPTNVLLGLALLAVSLWGVSVGGVTRWVALGPLIIQPAMMFVPLMAVLFARSRDTLSLTGITLAALALALQPDRGMAGALAAGLTVLALLRPDRQTLAGAGVALVGFAAAMSQADPSPAMPFVDQILYSAFGIHPLAGAAVVLGSALLVLPALAARRVSDPAQSAAIAFGVVWAALILAAALGNYPTPLVGYGGSAIVGYLLSVVVFARRAGERAGAPVEATPGPESDGPVLCLGQP